MDRLNNGLRGAAQFEFLTLKNSCTAIHPHWNRTRSLLDLIDRHRAVGQKAYHKGDTARRAALAIAPSPYSSRTNVKQRSNPLLRKVETAKRLVKFRRAHAPASICPESTQSPDRPWKILKSDEAWCEPSDNSILPVVY
jgi:hypothetical protein